MPNIVLLDDQVTKFPLVYRDAGGTNEPAPTGDVASVVSSAPASLGMAIGTLDTALTVGAVTYPAGSPALVLTPLVVESDAANGGGSISATLTDTAGLPMAMAYLFDITPDHTARSVGLDTTVMETTPQPVPTAPGP